MLPECSVKVVGHQWYWRYEGGLGGSYDSYMVKLNSRVIGDLRLLEVDLPLVLPVKSFIRVLVNSADVLHRFTVVGLGLKVDAVPGRLNYGFFYTGLLGRFFGQCSEICGVNHRFMPIKVEVVNSL